MMPGRTRTVVGGSHRDGREVPMVINAGFTIYSSSVSNREFFLLIRPALGLCQVILLASPSPFFFYRSIYLSMLMGGKGEL